MSSRLDLSGLRQPLKGLYSNGYHVASSVILQGLSRVVNVTDDQDWNAFRAQVTARCPSAWYGDDITSLLNDKTVATFCLSYRHVHRSQRPDGKKFQTMNASQWNRFRSAVLKFAQTYKSNKFAIWIDQILHCSSSMAGNPNWVTKGLLPYMVFPVMYIGGPDPREDDIHQKRLWVAVERACGLSSMGIRLQGASNDFEETKEGAYLSVPKALRWFSGRILGGVFNSYDLSWEGAYLSFRNLSIAIVKSKDAVQALERFLTSSPTIGAPTYSVGDAFIFSGDNQNVNFGGKGHAFQGTYLGSKLVKSPGGSRAWHGLQEWVQYQWDDGKLKDCKPEECDEIAHYTKWFVFEDTESSEKNYALGLVSAEGEVGALGMASLRGVTADGKGKVQWFQRGLSPLARQYCRRLFSFGSMGEGFTKEISRHWGVRMGRPVGMLPGKQIQWEWSRV